MASKIVRKVIKTPKAPVPITKFSQAVLVDRTLYLAGQMGFDTTWKIVQGGIAAETDQALRNIGHILEAAGTSFDKVVKVTIFLQDLKDYPQVHEVYNKYFPSRAPARAAVQVAALPKGGKVQIDAIAMIGEVEDV